MTYAQYVKKGDINFPLPASSHDIYYGVYGDWQAFALIVRFEAPTQDCIKHINTVLAYDDSIYHRTSSYPHIIVTNVAPVEVPYLSPAPWFTPNTITNGIYSGVDSSHTPQIWIDLNKGIFYFEETD